MEKKMNLMKFDGKMDQVDFLSLLMIDIRGTIRQVTLPQDYISDKIFEKGIGFDASNFGYAKVDKSDMVAKPDMSTAFVEIKGDYQILHVFCDVFLTTGEPFDQYPRAVAKKTAQYLKEQGIADDAKVLIELEFHAFDDVHYSSEFSHSYYEVQSQEGIGATYNDNPRFGIQQGYHRLNPADKYFDMRNDIVAAMSAVGIPVKYHHHEVAASQLEIELNFISLAEAGDKVSLAKWIATSVAREHGIFITFMPKPVYNIAGNGMHVHQFLVKNGKSFFAGDALHGLSTEALGYTAGILDHSLTGSLLAFSNPSTNSYKRLVKGFEAPVSATFAKGSREASIRVPGYLAKGEERIEYRTGDATANIYYFLSAMILAGAEGILKHRDPVASNYHDKDNGKLFPLSLNAVLDGLEQDHEYLLPVFPEALIKAWIKAKREEAAYVYNAPTPQEYELYFNI